MNDKDYHELLQRFRQTGTAELEKIVLPNSGFREEAIRAANEVLSMRSSGAPDPDEERRRAAMKEREERIKEAQQEFRNLTPVTPLGILFSMRGRVSLVTFWRYTLLMFVIVFILDCIFGILFNGPTPFAFFGRDAVSRTQPFNKFTVIGISTLILWMLYALLYKRLHDVGRPRSLKGAVITNLFLGSCALTAVDLIAEYQVPFWYSFLFLFGTIIFSLPALCSKGMPGNNQFGFPPLRGGEQDAP